MDILFELSRKKIHSISLKFERGLLSEINWDARLIGLKGSRGIGKTTLLLQYLKKINSNNNTSVYISLDHIWFSENKLTEFADFFVKTGGKTLFIDEVHKYPQWAQEIKNLYDDYPELKIVFTGSSLLEMLNARADLSRRAIMYDMHGLSFREYLTFVTGIEFSTLSLQDILKNHYELSDNIVKQIKPLSFFNTYLSSGYYPFFKELPELYHSRLAEVINMILEIELPLLRGIDIAYSRKLKQMLLVIAESVPFIPNISKLSERIGINRQTVLSYMHYLEDSELINTLHRDSFGLSRLQKPDKIFLQNPNLAYSLTGAKPNTVSLRETFFLNQLRTKHLVSLPEKYDFFIDNKYLFEIGGINKQTKKIEELDNSFFAIDNLEYGNLNRIPLWLFGFLY